MVGKENLGKMRGNFFDKLQEAVTQKQTWNLSGEKTHKEMTQKHTHTHREAWYQSLCLLLILYLCSI